MGNQRATRREFLARAARGAGAAAVGGSIWAYVLTAAARSGMIASGDCTNCGRCTPVCPEGSLKFGLRIFG